MASAYDPHPDREYAAVRNAAALFDVSPLHKYLISGRDAGRLLDRLITRDVTKLKVGQVYYTPWCDAAGKVVDDGTLSRLDEGTYRLTSADSSWRWLHMNAVGMEVVLEDVSEKLATLALQGPLSRAILDSISPLDYAKLKYFRVAPTTFRGFPVVVSRTGYTGDLGYELWVENHYALKLWDTLIEAGEPYGIVPAGVWALDIARIEAGLIMLDVDYFSSHHALIEARKSTPYEINLGWAVSQTKGPFNGRRALVAERERGAAWGFVGPRDRVDVVRAPVRRAPPAAADIERRVAHERALCYRGGSQIGYATSGCWSPLLKKPLALAHLRKPHFAPGHQGRDRGDGRARAQAAPTRPVRALPFYDPERKKA
jgi:aminomethyltransferase